MKLSTFQWIPLIGVIGLVWGFFSDSSDNVLNKQDNVNELIAVAVVQSLFTGLFLLYVVHPLVVQ